MKRKLFCEISPLTYKISYETRIVKRNLENLLLVKTANTFQLEKLPFKIFSHKSLMRRKLRKVPLAVEEAKVSNLKISVPKVNGILIKPGETFSFWNLVGRCTPQDGYEKGLVVAIDGELEYGTGGGMCQFSNLIHWIVLHTPLDIIEKHHHEQVDMFPDSHRNVPFGCGTSIVYNYFDYRFKNNTNSTYQLLVYLDDEYLYGDLYCSEEQSLNYKVQLNNEKFVEEKNTIYRCGEIYQYCFDEKNKLLQKKLIKKNHARVTYDVSDKNIIVKTN